MLEKSLKNMDGVLPIPPSCILTIVVYLCRIYSVMRDAALCDHA